jgi:hypothetical protein
MGKQEIQEQINELEKAYGDALNMQRDPNALSVIWRRITELKEELKKRS